MQNMRGLQRQNMRKKHASFPVLCADFLAHICGNYADICGNSRIYSEYSAYMRKMSINFTFYTSFIFYSMNLVIFRLFVNIKAVGCNCMDLNKIRYFQVKTC